MQIDREKALRELEIPEEMLNELLDVFVQQSAAALQSLEEAANNKNYEEIRKKAHFIKGAAENLRIDGIPALAKEIEFVARENQDIAGIKGDIEKLRMVFEEVKKEVSGR